MWFSPIHDALIYVTNSYYSLYFACSCHGFGRGTCMSSPRPWWATRATAGSAFTINRPATTGSSASLVIQQALGSFVSFIKEATATASRELKDGVTVSGNMYVKKGSKKTTSLYIRLLYTERDSSSQLLSRSRTIHYETFAMTLALGAFKSVSFVQRKQWPLFLIAWPNI